MPAPVTGLPQWADGGGADVVEPAGGKKSLGWVDGEAPPAEYFNWLQRQTFLWIEWFSQLLTAAASGDINLDGTFTNYFSACDKAMLSTINDAHDHPSSASNRWKLVLLLPTAGTSRVRLYVGEGTGSTSYWCITINAVWAPASAAQTWSKDDNAAESNILRGISGEVQWYGRSAAAGTWTDDEWDDQARGTFKTGGAITSASGAITATAGNVIATAGSMLSAVGFSTPGTTGSYRFFPAKTRTIPVQMTGIGTGCDVSGANGALSPSAPGTFIQIPLAMPDNATSCDIEVMFRQNTTTPATYRIVERTANWASPTAASESTIATVATPASIGYNKLTLNISAITPGAEYRLIMEPGDALDTIQAIRAVLVDAGPVNTM